jgi:DNA-directed RNA polymerase subunit K/omega
VTDEVNPQTSEETVPPEPVEPPESRFLFVDVAALRAKQLRRGALPKLGGAGDGRPREAPHKLERIAMEEVRMGLISYELPEPGSSKPQEAR